MDIDNLTLGGTDYEDMLMRDATDTMSSDDGTGGDVVGVSPGRLAYYYNYSTLESVVSEAWEGARVRAPGVQLHEGCVLLLSALVVGVHGLLGLLPRSLLTVRAAWLLLYASLGLGCLYGLACLLVALHNALVRRLFRDDDGDVEDEDGDEEDEEEEEEDGETEGKEVAPLPPLPPLPPPLDLEQSAEGAPPLTAAAMEGIVSAQLEKEERVQRWIDNLVPDREQVNLEACGEIKGRNMEAEASNADLLGDGQLDQPPTATASASATATATATATTTAMAPRSPRPLPLPLALPTLPPMLPPAEVGVSQERRRALMLAYELSLAVRQQTTGNIRATLSAPGVRQQSVQPRLSSLSSRATLSEHKDAWKLVRRGKEALDDPLLPLQDHPDPVTIDLTAASHAVPAVPAPAVPSPRPPREFLESALKRRRLAEESRTPRSDSAPGTPTAEAEAGAETPAAPAADVDSPPPTPPNPSAPGEAPTETPSPSPLNASSSLLSFVRRFSGTRFLLRELANATADGLSLRVRDTRPLPLPPPLPLPEDAGAQDPTPQRSVLALPKVSVGAVQGQAPATASRQDAAISKAEAETSVTPERIPPHREKSNVMKVFSKGILSEGSSTVDISTTSIQQDHVQRHTVAAPGSEARVEALGGALSLLAQETAGLVRAIARTTTATAATSTTESDEAGAAALAAAPTLARSTVNLCNLGARAREPVDPQDLLISSPMPMPITTSRGLTANMSEEGIPWSAPPTRYADLDDEHKSLFDMRKSLLSSIPEAAPPDEDPPHYF